MTAADPLASMLKIHLFNQTFKYVYMQLNLSAMTLSQRLGKYAHLRNPCE